MIRLFVYGSLAPGKENHHLLENIPGTWESATLTGELLDKGWGAELGCPGLVLSDQGQQIQGHIFTSNHLSDHWPVLDAFEGDDYQRTLTIAQIDNGTQVSVYVYTLNKGVINDLIT